MIETIKEALAVLGKNVQHGIPKKENTWDCLVVRKERLEKSGTSRLDNSFYISVSVVCEDEVPEGIEFEIEKIMKEIGFRRTSSPAKYDYTVDANEIIIEICKIEFVKAMKRECE